MKHRLWALFFLALSFQLQLVGRTRKKHIKSKQKSSSIFKKLPVLFSVGASILALALVKNMLMVRDPHNNGSDDDDSNDIHHSDIHHPDIYRFTTDIKNLLEQHNLSIKPTFKVGSQKKLVPEGIESECIICFDPLNELLEKHQTEYVNNMLFTFACHPSSAFFLCAECLFKGQKCLFDQQKREEVKDFYPCPICGEEKKLEGSFISYNDQAVFLKSLDALKKSINYSGGIHQIKLSDILNERIVGFCRGRLFGHYFFNSDDHLVQLSPRIRTFMILLHYVNPTSYEGVNTLYRSYEEEFNKVHGTTIFPQYDKDALLGSLGISDEKLERCKQKVREHMLLLDQSRMSEEEKKFLKKVEQFDHFPTFLHCLLQYYADDEHKETLLTSVKLWELYSLVEKEKRFDFEKNWYLRSFVEDLYNKIFVDNKVRIQNAFNKAANRH